MTFQLGCGTSGCLKIPAGHVVDFFIVGTATGTVRHSLNLKEISVSEEC